MPELPEVHLFKSYIDSTALHQEISGVEIDDEYVIKDTNPDTLREALVGAEFAKTERHGKHLFLNLEGNSNHTVMLHFGMTGEPQYFKNSDSEPEFTRFRVDFENGYHLSFDCPRKLGEIRLVDNKESYIKEKKLGPDFKDLSREEFYDIMEESRAMVKSTIMNQEIMAGIGNLYSDEALFQAAVYPKKKCNKLSEYDKEAVFDCLHEVIDIAIETKIDPDQYPDTYLQKKRNKGVKCPMCGGRIAKMKINSRNCFYCRDHQNKL